jgi:hypothetical protein
MECRKHGLEEGVCIGEIAPTTNGGNGVDVRAGSKRASVREVRSSVATTPNEESHQGLLSLDRVSCHMY